MTELMETYIENRTLVQPNHTNMLGKTHGGHVMKWMDEVGAMAAMRFSGETCVTARVDRMNFELPIRLGDSALVTAYVYDAGATSVKTRVTVEREDLRTGESELTTESYFVYVAIDEDEHPTTIPDLTVATEDGERLRTEALEGESGQGR
ncbi:acyl-CoA hydrolase [Halovivax ruber XH-70]|uniref:Acyl-CoA hydrolase n=1 Tax=Halovivax ruber (strain DSM 18193 / JCM 13892 / XH-70) TaxID=797302 RepID=L0IBB5_HALRX|nr:acyl-CoA thioesterase [Halovivax ruber]AGB16113.1 acyl-CoA hydrolase [Halovivax ruber XH-70]